MLTESGELDREKLDRAVAEGGGNLGVFVRSLVGLDRGAVNDALSGFMRDSLLSANQMEFLNMIVEYLTRHGILAPAQLFESPFTEIAPHGPDVIFHERFGELVVVLEDMRTRASAS